MTKAASSDAMSGASSVAVVGAGTMGTGIAYVFAAAGWTTTVVEPDAAQQERSRAQIERAVAGGITRGRLDEAGAAALRSRLSSVREVADVRMGLELIVESVPERRDLKREVLGQCEERGPVVLASNTSSLSIDELSEDLAQPERFLGLHFFNPVWSLPLVEVVRGAQTDALTLERALAAVAAIGKQAAVVTDSPGFATSRLDLIAALEAMRMVEAGVGSAEDIDRAVSLAYRHPVGPLRLSDIVGLDVRLDIARRLEVALGERFAPPRILVDLVADGRLGQKSGRGFYDWTDEGD